MTPLGDQATQQRMDRLVVVQRALDASDEEVGRACMNVPVPETIAKDGVFREAYTQGYRHALTDVRALSLDRLATELCEAVRAERLKAVGMDPADPGMPWAELPSEERENWRVFARVIAAREAAAR